MSTDTITLGGRARKLRFDMNALADLEAALGQTIAQIGVRMSKGRIGLRELRALTWAGILHEDEDVTVREVGTWLHEAGFMTDETTQGRLTAVLFKALAEAFPEQAAAVEAQATGNGKTPKSVGAGEN